MLPNPMIKLPNHSYPIRFQANPNLSIHFQLMGFYVLLHQIAYKYHHPLAWQAQTTHTHTFSARERKESKREALGGRGRKKRAILFKA